MSESPEYCLLQPASIRFIGLSILYTVFRQEKEVTAMMIDFFKKLLSDRSAESAIDAEYEPFREELVLVGLSEDTLRKMDPDDRVAALERAKLDPYNYIYLAC